MNLKKRANGAAAIMAALSLLVEPSARLTVAASQGQPPPKPASAPAPSPSTPQTQPGAKPSLAAVAAATPVDGGWPRMYSLPSEGSILVYQPQVASWEKQSHLVAFSAVSHRSKAGDKPALGTIKLEADTKVALTERLVSFQQMKITEANFQTLEKEQVREIVAEIDKAMPDDERVIALDRVLANVDKSQIVPKPVEGIKADPPTIFFSKTPAVIVNLDGDPIWSPIKGNDLKYAVNTNWDLFENSPTKTYYLRSNDTWLKATDVKGPWSPAGTLPDAFKQLPADENWKDVKASLPGRAIKSAPQVFVSTTPAELILLTGEPNYLLVQGTNLLWVSNTDSDVFRMGKTGSVYYLVAGRWFSAPDFTGPWTFATPSLPADFQKIPVSHDRSRVLASVPGTDQAAEAVLLAQIPQTARVNKKETKAPEVDFQGNPEFVPIEKTTVQRAVNTDKDVFKIGDLYYMCYQGVWFSGKSASGPWEVASSVPQEIYQIPSSSPAHHVTYVTVEEDDDDDWVVFAAAAGYTGMMVAWGCTVWGTGWVLSTLLGIRRLLPVPTILTFQPTGTRRGTTRGRAHTGAAPGFTVLMAAPASVRGTTRVREPMRAARPHMDRTARAASRRPTTPARGRTRQPARDRTSTEAGVRPQFSAATTGPRPTATRTGRQGPPRARSEPTRGQRSRVVVPAAAPWVWVRAGTSMRATTGTSIAARTGRGRSTTTATGRIPTGNPVRHHGRPIGQPRGRSRSIGAAWTEAPSINSIAIPRRVARARSEPTTTVTTGAAAAPEAPAATGEEGAHAGAAGGVSAHAARRLGRAVLTAVFRIKALPR